MSGHPEPGQGAFATLGRTAPDSASALLTSGRAPLSYADLRKLQGATVARLNDLGIGRGARVAIVLPNGPEMAAAFLAIGAGTTVAPLNPAYREEEFDFYLNDLGAQALVIQEGVESPVRAVAERLGIPVLELRPRTEAPAGTFDLLADTSVRQPLPTAGGFAEATDVALLLHTSGTTSRPKIVPLTQANLVASARHIAETLQLTPEDRCLNIMPLFHIHGLVAAVLSSIAAGGSVFCTPGFNALKFFSWLDEAEASWYTAVPTMHQAILARAGRNRDVLDRRRLRLVRSSSASLAPQVMAQLEATFGCPVIEAYGMTEAAHQMTSNPLPPARRKAGMVGCPAGPEVRIMGSDGSFAEPGTPGEVVIRGPNVTAGYENNPQANETAFADGWFRTGDEGVFDQEGYLTITGRLKEMINRGGEKIAPIEIDQVVLGHPAVAQAVTFALQHDKLGEEVAIAVVRKEGAEVGERDIRDFAAKCLADFKVPRKVIFVEEIPKGATGKLQRIGLAKKLGLE